MFEKEEKELIKLLNQLKKEHNIIENTISNLQEANSSKSQLQINLLKRYSTQKLERIQEIEDILFPDLIA